MPPGLVLFNIYIGNLGTKNKSVMMQCAYDTKLRTIINAKEAQNIVREEADDFEDWHNRNGMKIIDIKCKATYLWGINKSFYYILIIWGTYNLETTEVERDHGCPCCSQGNFEPPV